MEPCSYLRVVVGDLAVKLPSSSAATPPAGPGVHPAASPFYCRLRLGRLPARTAPVALHPSPAAPVSAAFDLDGGAAAGKGGLTLRISVYAGRRGAACGLVRAQGRLVGRVEVPVGKAGRAFRSSGWVGVGVGGAEVHVSVRAEPEPRFVFEFEGEPECSPQVLQVTGGLRQPVFTCRFGCSRNHLLGDRGGHRSLTRLQSDSNSSKTWLGAFGSGRERSIKERKGWSIIVHDLSGSPVALASMVTPFVASPGKDHVARSNPGAWLVLRPGDGTWKPWGRLEAWRERNDRLGFRFELSTGALLAESSLSTHKGGKFIIDLTGNNNRGDHGGFIMSSTVEGEGKCSKPVVEIGTQNVGCTEDAAAFVALAAAMDLSMDACRLFPQKLRKELCGQQETLA